MTDSIIRAARLAYVRVAAPDLVEAEAFLLEFGLVVATRTAKAIYLRGSDGGSHCYVLEQGAPAVTAIAFEAESAADLEALSKVEGASEIEKLDEPAGGEGVRLRDPQGMQVEVVYGQSILEPLETGAAHAYNMNGDRPRQGTLPALSRGPSRVRRIGHLVLESADPDTVFGWYRDHLGLRRADTVRLPNGRTQMLFASLDRGREFVDHHVVGFQYALDEGRRVQHVAFEVDNVDELMSGREHLKRKGRKSVWGVGRHRFGGQIFDYWLSPWGLIHEHWTDTDLVNEDHVPSEGNLIELQDYWGPPPSIDFAVARWNWKTVRNLVSIFGAQLRAGRR